MVKIIAEIGCNHKGDIKIAKELIKSAKICGANVAKFQKRNPKELLSPEEYNAPHPNPINSYGKTYGEHREFLEFSVDQHKELKEYCEKLGIIYSTSIWDLTSAKEIVSINPQIIKIPSAQNTNFFMLQYICDNYDGEIHISFGMTGPRAEKDLLRSGFSTKGREICGDDIRIFGDLVWDLVYLTAKGNFSSYGDGSFDFLDETSKDFSVVDYTLNDFCIEKLSLVSKPSHPVLKNCVQKKIKKLV